MDLSYLEKQDKLNDRIRAHKEFANFDVSEWLEGYLARKQQRVILDLGCGNGNHLGLYLEHVGSEGRVAGLDRETSLVEEARERCCNAPNLGFDVASMDDPLPYGDGTFDSCFSLFSVYNAASPRDLFTELKRVLKPGGELVMVGPTMNNARELYEYNERLTGEAIDQVTLIRTDRLRQEILPIANEMFDSVEIEVLNSFLTFPNREEFIRYFTATMLYEEGAKKIGVSADEMMAACASDRDIILSKEMLAVVAVNSD